MSKNLFAVGIASSAGGLKPLMELLENAHCHKNMCFILVPHLSRDYQTNLPRLIRRVSSLESKLVQHEMKLESCKLYILPPGQYVSVLGDKLQLAKRPKTGPNQSANVLFSSLAKSYKQNSIGVVLSGSLVGADGAKGIIEIKKAGGHTYAQTLESAQYSDMPRLSIETGCVDSVLPASEIGHDLTLVNWALE